MRNDPLDDNRSSPPAAAASDTEPNPDELTWNDIDALIKQAQTDPLYHSDKKLNFQSASERWASSIDGSDIEPCLGTPATDFLDYLQYRLDDLDNIYSRFFRKSPHEPAILIRDARKAHPAQKDDAKIALERAYICCLQRCFTTMRSILFAGHTKQHDGLKDIMCELSIQFEELRKNPFTTTEELKKLEGRFNGRLIDALIKLKLTKPGQSTEDYQKLLTYYRNFSSVIDPAHIIYTLIEKVRTLQQKGDSEPTEVTDQLLEVESPITVLTEEQLCKLDELKVQLEGNPTLNDAGKALLIFIDQVRNPTTRPSSQLRKFPNGYGNIFGLLNGYSVRTILKTRTADGETFTLIDNQFVRHGALAASKEQKGADNKRVRADAAARNIQQIQAILLPTSKLHLMTLITPSVLNRGYETSIFEATRQAATSLAAEGEPGQPVSVLVGNCPFNFIGALEKGKIGLQGSTNGLTPWSSKGTLLARSRSVSLVTTVPAKRKEIINKGVGAAIDSEKLGSYTVAISCASGQDRTGTFIILFQVKKIALATGLSLEEAAEFYAIGRIVQTVATAATPGSYAIKDDSCIPGLFSSAIDGSVYIPLLAKTNKKRPIQLPTTAKLQKKWGSMADIWQKAAASATSSAAPTDIEDDEFVILDMEGEETDTENSNRPSTA
jgi:hypothetical protein